MKYFSNDWYSDCAIMYEYLEQMHIVSGTDRNKLHYVNPKIGGSSLYGYTWKGYLSPTKSRTKAPNEEKLYQTKLKDFHPDFINVAREFRDLYFPEFMFSQIQINKNYRVGPHLDSSNVGESVLCAFGDYTGGEIFIDVGSKIITKDPRDKPIKFNGSIYKHWVNNFEGTRYSLVFFHNLKKYPYLKC